MECPWSVRPVMPGLPGVTTTSAVRPMARAKACSRPPDPTTHTVLTGRPALTPPLPLRARSCGKSNELLASGTHPDQPDRRADQIGQKGDVIAGTLGKIAQFGGTGNIGPPPGKLFVDRGDLVKDRLVVGGVVVPHAVSLVGHTDLDGV